MTNDKTIQALCPIGNETLIAAIKGGYQHLTLGLVVLLNKGYVPGQFFSSRDLLECGLGPDLVKTIIKQCEGREFDTRKGPKKKDNKLIKTRKMNNELSLEEKKELDEIIKELDEIINDLSTPSRPHDPSSSNFVNNYLILKLINGIDEDTDRLVKRLAPPNSETVKTLFSIANRSQLVNLLQLKTKPTRGPSPKLFAIPTPDMYGAIFNVQTPDIKQVHYPISEHKTVKRFCDALHRAWMENYLGSEIKKIRLLELCNIMASSTKTVRAQNKRCGIHVEQNTFSSHVNSRIVKGLIYQHRGGTWFELDLHNPKIQKNMDPGKKSRFVPRYPVNWSGVAKAKDEWEAAELPGNFYNFLRICGYNQNSYSLMPDTTSLLNSNETRNTPNTPTPWLTNPLVTPPKATEAFLWPIASVSLEQ